MFVIMNLVAISVAYPASDQNVALIEIQPEEQNNAPLEVSDDLEGAETAQFGYNNYGGYNGYGNHGGHHSHGGI